MEELLRMKALWCDLTHRVLVHYKEEGANDPSSDQHNRTRGMTLARIRSIRCPHLRLELLPRYERFLRVPGCT